MIERVKASMGKWDNIGFRIDTRLKRSTLTGKQSLQQIPVIINNFNRLDCLKEQIGWLEKMGMRRIYIIDNASTYSPLLDYYNETKHHVFLLNRNVGFMALWQTILFQRFRHDYYIYTDPDIIPVAECPDDAISFFYELLQRYPETDKVGFGLEIEDIPDHYPLKEKVQNWESQYWINPLEPNVYQAPIDTSFALYRPGKWGGSEL